MERIKCKCGCGRFVRKNKKFIVGHNFRMKGNTPPESEKIRCLKISQFVKKHFNDPIIREKLLKTAWIGRPHTEETILKMKKVAVIREKQKKERGYIVSEETRKKISISNMGRIHSGETRKKISDAQKGRHLSTEQIEKMRIGVNKYYETHFNHFKGKKHKPESIQKMKESLFGKYRGAKASNWQGGIDSFPYAVGWTPHFINSIRERDHYECQNPNCEIPYSVLDVHHIDYDKQNNDDTNLITLCKRCHGKTQKNREFWKEYYQNIVKNRMRRVPKMKRIKI